MEFCDNSWNLINFACEFYIKFVPFLPNLRNIASVRMSTFFNKMSQKQNLSKEMIMENRETVIEKSWEKFLQSLWEP